MRPLRLVLQGFRSHGARTEVDFSGRSLIAIVGPTGAGKSSLLDGVTYALYGKTSRVQKDTKSLICSSCDSAEVQLVFEVDGVEHTVTRTMRRRGAGAHVLENGTGEPIVGDARVTEAISEMLHLDFPGFCSSVLLAQGRFSEFLDAAPDRRTRILKAVFRFDQLDEMREAAGVRRREAELERARAEGALGQIPDRVDELLAAARAAHEAASARVDRIDAARPEERALLERHAGAAGDAARARDELARIVAVGSELASAEDIDRLCRDEEDLRDPLAKARVLLEEAREHRSAAADELAALQEKAGTRAELLDLRAEAQGLVEWTGAAVAG
ncbi:MAG TPA: SMC family ATPase, partial [Actinomycetota bacterium]|nr:SMC family ATPase [Actinomycetota bacterium]